MSEYDRDFWEERWSQALRERGDRVAQRPPNAHLRAEYARPTAEAMGPDIAERIDWVQADLASWTPASDEYDLVLCFTCTATLWR
jgi:hypothetical protein